MVDLCQRMFLTCALVKEFLSFFFNIAMIVEVFYNLKRVAILDVEKSHLSGRCSIGADSAIISAIVIFLIIQIIFNTC